MITPFLPSSQMKAAKLLAALVFAGLAQQGIAAGPAANALPTGGKVVAGSATIAQSGNTMNINQSSQRAVINWNSFDVGSKATVNFNQPNAQAATLNYVNSASKSMINGAVNANGQVIFVNNNGIVFGKGAQVNVGGMVATTMNTSAKEFMDGKDIQTYEGGNSNGKIINKGHITGNNINSYIALMAPQVKNTGVITATLGGNNAVALVAGEKVSLTFSNSQLVSVSVDASVVNALISNKLLINAGNGQVIIAANSAQDLMGSVIKNTGSISANGISTAGGKISLTADTIEHSGVIEANSSQAAGGNISLKGNNITLASGSKTTATGATAGGNINVGVNNTSTQSVQNAIDNNHLANTVSVQSNATVDASATQSGNGGTINIWSKLSTMIAGALSAKGGVQGGNGGFIETSSKGNVTIAGSAVIDTSAPKGKTGQWTVDPMTLIIDSTAASVISNALNTTNVTLDATRSNSSACAFGSCTNSQSALIRIMAGADIYSSNTATSLNLIATGGQIDINSNITAGQVYAVAQAINVNGSINTNGGNNSNIYLAGAIINILGNINSNGSNSNNSNNTNSSNLNSANTTTANNRRNGQNGLNADSNNYTSNGGLINILATGDINIGSNSYISANGINGGAVTIVSTAGKTTINGIVDSIGKATNGGNIAIVGKTQTDIIAALIGSEGVSQGGVINLGQVNNLGNGTILAPPATAPPALTNFVNTALAAAVDSNNSITSSNINLDSQTGINAPNGTIVVFGDQIQINNSSLAAINGDIAIGRPSYSQGAVASLVAISNSTLTANRVETSGDLLGTQNTAVVSNEWLLDPTTVTITAAASTGGTLASALAATGASNISTADIVAAINAGNTVNVVATGAITQAGALAFAPATGITGTLILDNHLTQGSSITSSGGITSSGAGTVNLQFLAGGQSLVSGAITASSGPINVVMQSYWQANTTNAGSGANVINTAPITTRGGYVIMDGTGGTINSVNQTITMGTVNVGYLQNIYPQASINTTTNAGVVSATSTGGNFIGAGYDAVSGGTMGAYQSTGATLNIGGFVNIQAKSAGTNSYGYVISGYGAGPINAAGNITITANSSSTGIVGQDIYLSAGTTLTSYTGSVNISNTSTGNGSGLTTNAAISAATGITINNTNVGAIGVWSDADGTLTTTAGTISITSTSTGSGVYAVSLAGLITAPKVTITGTNSTAGGLGASVTGGVTITNVAGTYTSVGDALNITTTVGTNGTTGGINVTTGAITNNSNGGDVLFQSNGAITQTGGLTLAANTTTHDQNVKYDTTSGNGGSAITIGAITSQGASISAPVKVTVVATGAITQTGAWAFAPATGITDTLILDNHLTQGSSITSSGGITSSGAGTVNLQFLAGGQSLVSGAITASSGPINVVMQSYWQANTTNAGSGANVINTAPITTRGGYVIMDGTGGNIDLVHQTITMGTVNVGYLQNIYPQASINTTTNAGVVSATSTGGNFIGAGYDAVSGGTMGAYESLGATLNIGGFVNIQAKSAGTNSYGYVISGYGAGPINAAGNITITANSSSTGIVGQDIYLSAGTTLTSYTGSVNISNTSTGNGSGLTTNAAISAATGITINNTNVGAIGVQSNAAGTLTTTAGTISITSTSTGSGIYAESLAGLITAPKVTITGTNSTAGGLGASVTGGVTITNVAGTYASVGDALNITTTVGTNGTTGGINVTTGAITNNSNGGDVTFKTNGDITATSIVSFATANTTNHVQTLTYDTRTGNLNSQITAGIFTFNATGATNKVNYQILSNGSALTVPAVTVSGTILLDNTCASNASYTCSTPLTASSATTVNTTASVGISLTGAQTSGQGITINGINASASNAAVALGANGLTVTSAASFPTAGVNAISVIGNTNTANIGNPGISSTGAIAVQSNGGDVLFQSNGDVSQSGGLTLAANSTGHAQAVSYNTTSGSNTSSITIGAITSAGASASSPVNLSVLSRGTILVNSGISISNTGPLNVVMQSFDTANPGAGIAGNILLYGTGITTRGGYIILDGTGGTVSGSTLTPGTIVNGAVNMMATGFTLNTTTTNTTTLTSATTGGDISISASQSVGGSAYQQYLINPIYSGGTFNLTAKASGGALYAQVFANHNNTSPIVAVGNINISTTSSAAALNDGPQYWTSAITSVSGSVSLTNSSTTPVSGIQILAPISAATGITINNNNFNGTGVYSTAAISTTSGAITINSTDNIAGFFAVNLTGSVTAPQVGITASNANATGKGVSVTGGVTITAGTYATVSDALNITSTVATDGLAGGIVVTGGAITNNSNGGSVTLVTNGDITATSAVSFATANTTSHAQTLTYDTRSGNKTSQITTGVFTFNSTGATGAVNYIQESNGSPLTVGATSVSGNILIDNTKGGATLAADATTGTAILVNGALTSGVFAGTNAITLKAIAGTAGIGINNAAATDNLTASVGNISLISNTSTGSGIIFTSPITATTGGVVLTGVSTTATPVTDTGLITGNSITVTGTGTTAATVVSLGAMTINACSAGVACNSNNISVTGNDTAAGNQIGITQTGAITDNASGGNILFKSNNQIVQNGTISIAQNTSGTPSSIVYDTTLGNKLSLINAGAVTFNGTSTSYINYSNITAGAEITVNSALNVPGSITFDNTYINGVQGAINPTNAWNNATTASVAIPITASLTAINGIYIRGAVGATNNNAAPGFDAITITGGTAVAPIVLQTTGVFAAGADAINIVGIEPSQNTTKNAINIANYTQINNNSTAASGSSWGGNTNIVAYSGRYNDAITVTNASTAGAIEVSAIGSTASIVTVAGTLFTQNSNAGIFIATSENGNVTPPKIVNNGTGPVVIEAGAYLAVGTVSTSCAATACGQITAVSGNNITSPNGNVYLYAGSPGVTAGTTSTQASLGLLSPSLGDFTFSNTLFSQAYAAGNVAATSLPIFTLGGINTANVAGGTGGTSWNTGAITSTNTGPVIQFRISPSYTATLSGNVTKVYGTNDPLATAGNLTTPGSLDYQLQALYTKTTNNSGWVSNGTVVGTGSSAITCASTDGCALITVNSVNFVVPLGAFVNSLQALPPTPRTSYGTLAGEQVNTNSTSYTYNITSTHGISVSSGVTINSSSFGNVGLVITPAPLTITASNQAVQAGIALPLGTTAFTSTGLITTVDGVTLGDSITSSTLTSNGLTTVPTTLASGVYAPPNVNSITPSAAVFAPVSGSRGAANYAITYVGGTLTSSANAIVTITALADTKIYGNSTTTNGVTYNSNGLGVVTIGGTSYSISSLPVGDTLNGLSLTSLGGIATAPVGSSYQITPSAAVITGTVPYTLNYVSALMTVQPRPITIAAVGITTTYGTPVTVSQNLTTGYTIGGSGLGASDTLTSVAVNYYNGTTNSTTVPGSTGAATYYPAITTSAATGTGGFNSTNYNITYTPANLVVNRLAVSLTANSQSTVYGTALALGTTAYTSSLSSLPNGDRISGVTLQYNSSATVPGTTNALTYTGGIVASSATGTGGFGVTNYAITYSLGNLTVTPANVVITPANVSASGQTVMYNGAAQTFNPSTGFTVTGMQNSQALVFSTNGLASGLNVGTYANTITTSGSNPTVTGVTNGGSLSNYNISVSAQGSLTITPAPLTVAGATSNVAYNGSLQNNGNPVVSVLLGIDTQSGNGVTVTGKSSGTNAGTYNDALSVTAAGATQLSNYTITKTNGSLVISKLAATVTGATKVNPYTGLLQTNTYTTTGILSGDTANVTIAGSAAATHVSQGTVPDVFSVSGSAAGNYAFTYAPGSITITPVALSVVGANTTQVYNATTQTNTVATVTGLKPSDTATIAGSYGAGKNVGTYADALTVGLSNSSDYTIGVTNGSITITPATITISGITANNKVYNATTAATLNIGTITYSGVFAGDTVSVNTSNLSGTFVDKNVGTAKTVNISGVVLGGSSSANYQLSGGANTTTTANITPAPLTITGSNLTTTYNGAAQSLTSPTVGVVIAGDNVVVATTGGTGTNAGVYATSYAASGTDAGNYTVISNTPTLTINKASLVVAANNSGKVVNQLDPTLSSTVSGLQGSDTASSVFVSPYGGYTTTRATGESAGSYAITASGPATLQNYNVTYTPATFTIAGAGQLLITMNAATTTYGTAATPTIASVQYGSLANSTLYTLTVASSSGNAVTYTDGAGGTITITPSITGASVASNVGSYALATANTNTGTATSAGNFTSVLTVANTLTITPAPLTLKVADVSKTYNANAVIAAQITAGSLTGGVANGVTVTSGALMNSQTIADLGGVVYTGPAVGAINASSTPYAINGSVGSGFSNYAVTIVPGTLTVNAAPLVVNGALTSRTYSGALQTNAAATIAGLQGSDTLTIAGYATGTHAGRTADALVATGAAASNYSITYNNGALTINPAALLVTGANNQYAYNGALQTNTGASISGLKGSDTATVAGYASATHVAQGIVPDVLVATVSSPADYTVTYVQGSLQITPIVITAAVNTATVMYNAASQTTGFVVTGLKGTDTATAASGTATGTNVGTYTSNLVLNTSSDYTVGAITNGTLTITPAPLTISGGLTANNKVYDTTNAATIGVTGNQTLAGVLGTDAVTVSSTGPYTGATFTQSNVGSGLTVTPATTSSVINGASYTTMAGVTLGGAAAGNYYVTGVGPQTLTANITPAPLTISSGLTANNKAYDGTTAATISSATQTLAGVLASDVGNVAISSSGPYTGAFSQSNVGTGLAVSASTTPTTIAGGTYNAMTGVTLSGSAQGNYYVAGLSTPITANITPYVINFGSGSGPNIAAVANNKVYTSTTSASGSLSMVNLFGTDSVSVSYTSAAFASPNVATGAAVTFNGVTLSGASAANYSIGSTPVTATANITPALLTITAVDKSSFYSQGLATLTQAPAIGLLGSDTVTGATITTTATSTGANAAVGAYPITISAATGSGLSNYSINYVPANYTIVGPGALVITTAGVTTPYGTGTSGNILAPALPTASYTSSLGGVISSLTYVSSSTTLKVTSYTFRDASNNDVTFNLAPSNVTTSTSGNITVGSYAYAASNLVSSTGLTSAIPSGNFTVTPLAVTITAPAATHAYNGAVQTQLAATASPAILTNDLVTVSGAASGKNVGVYGSNLATSGLDAGNYNFTYVNANLTITPFIIGSGGSGAPSIAATANNKVYDTTTVAPGALAMTNLFAGDSVSVAYTSAAFASPNVANGLTVNFSGVTLSGAAAANYSVTSTPTATANITPAPLTISGGLTANNKVYDTTNAATIGVTGNQTLAGVLGTDGNYWGDW
ncbi:hypothetical protein G6726_02230 [Polynucleobacter paneuropaeus]|nr:hypothetical protein G6726_02230 [Polynucleobacter paneuropaeus]